MKEMPIHKELAQRFVKDKGYTAKQFKEVSVDDGWRENEVYEWVDSVSGLLKNYEDEQWNYKRNIYEKVCDLLKIG